MTVLGRVPYASVVVLPVWMLYIVALDHDDETEARREAPPAGGGEFAC